jgi:hypothetical protein
MNRLQQMLRMGGMGGPTNEKDGEKVDTSETVYISSLALLKMLKHGRAGVPMEVMGLMLGEFVDDYTVRCIDVFAMPQSKKKKINSFLIIIFLIIIILIIKKKIIKKKVVLVLV